MGTSHRLQSTRIWRVLHASEGLEGLSRQELMDAKVILCRVWWVGENAFGTLAQRWRNISMLTPLGIWDCWPCSESYATCALHNTFNWSGDNIVHAMVNEGHRGHSWWPGRFGKYARIPCCPCANRSKELFKDYFCLVNSKVSWQNEAPHVWFHLILFLQCISPNI